MLPLQLILNYVNHKAIQALNQGLSPGFAIGIVTKNNILFTNGYGLADIEKNIPYTPDTVNLLASVSKPISGTMLCLLQKERTMVATETTRTITIARPDMPDESILDAKTNIKMSIDYVTKEMLVQDALCHHTGAPTQYGTYLEAIDYSHNEIICRLPYVINTDFRNAYRYNNHMFYAGVQVGVATAGISLEDGYEQLFNLIGMRNTTLDYYPDKYVGYLKAPDNCVNKWIRSGKYNVDQQLSAGGIYSTVNDLKKFIQFHLVQQSLPDADKLISPRFYNGIYTIDTNADTNSQYGLGILVSYTKYNNQLYKVFDHSGLEENVHTAIAWAPQLDIGIVILTNSAPSGFPEALTSALFSLMAGSTIKQADTLYNEALAAITGILAADICSFKTCCNVSNNYICNKDSAKCRYGRVYNNNENGQVVISDDGYIKIGYLEFVPLIETDDGYTFVLKNKFELAYPGTVKIIDDTHISIDYFCVTGIYYAGDIQPLCCGKYVSN